MKNIIARWMIRWMERHFSFYKIHYVLPQSGEAITSQFLECTDAEWVVHRLKMTGRVEIISVDHYISIPHYGNILLGEVDFNDTTGL